MEKNREKKRAVTVVVVMVVMFVLRYLLSQRIGLYFVPDAGVDDILLLRYSDTAAHFQYPDTYSLAKNMPFSLVLHFCEQTGIRYSLVLLLIWVLAALTTAALAFNLTKNRWISVLFYVLTLFSPVGLEQIAARVYRLSILPPLVMILFGMMILGSLYLVKRKEHTAGFAVLNLFVGIIGTFTAYIKEDGLWIVCCMAFSCLVNAVYILYGRIHSKKHTARSVILLAAALLPMLIYAGGTVHYKNVNERAFGVRLINNRTEGEMAEFINRLYLIDSEERTGDLWAPQDAVEQAIAVSPTLAANETVTRALRTGSNYGLPIKGDFMGWVLLTAIDELEWDIDYKGVQDWFGQVNTEIDAAFEDGRLMKENRFQLLPSTGGKTGKEIAGVIKEAFRTAGSFIWLDKLDGMNATFTYNEANQHWLRMMSEVTGDEKLFRLIDDATVDQAEREKTRQLILHIFSVYRVLNTFLLAVSVAAFVFLTVRIIGKKIHKTDDVFVASVMLVMTGILLVYAFCIAWFCSFLDFYANISYGGTVYMMMIYVFLGGAATVYMNRKELKNLFWKGEKNGSDRGTDTLL